jgi:hypothetical protein
MSLAQSKFNPAKRFGLLSSNTQTESMIIGIRGITEDITKERKKTVV